MRSFPEKSLPKRRATTTSSNWPRSFLTFSTDMAIWRSLVCSSGTCEIEPGNPQMPSWLELCLSGLALITLLYFGQAFLTSSPSRRLNSNERQKSSLSRSIAVVIPTLNETSVLSNTISQLFNKAVKKEGDGQPVSSITVIVVDASPDVSPTKSSLGPLLSTHPASLRLVHYSGKPSRGLQMNFGADYAAKVAPEASVLVFLHADTYLPPAWDECIFNHLSNSPYQPLLGCFKLSLPSPISLSLRIMLWSANKRATWAHMPYGDQCYFLTRADFERLGRFPEVPIMEDVGLLRRVSQHGGRVEVLDASVETSKRRWEKNGVWWNTILNQVFMTAWLCGTPPETIYRWYYGTRQQVKVKS